MNRKLENEEPNFFVDFVSKRCLLMHRRRIDGLIRSLRALLEHHNRGRISQVDFLLRFNLVMFQYMTYERPNHMNAVLVHERRRNVQMNPEDLGREVLDSIITSMRDRFESNNVSRLLFYEDPRSFFDERLFPNINNSNVPNPISQGFN
jgi:hypothetical protein